MESKEWTPEELKKMVYDMENLVRGLHDIMQVAGDTKSDSALNRLKAIKRRASNALRTVGLHRVKDRPVSLGGMSYQVGSHFGNIYINITELDGLPFEVFVAYKYDEAEVRALTEGLARMVSAVLRLNGSPQLVIEQLQDIESYPEFHDGVQIKSIPDAIAHAFKTHMEMKNNGDDDTDQS